MNFDEWVRVNKTASGIQELANDDCVSACQEAWSFQQEKIDALIEIMCHGDIDNAKSIAKATNNKKLIDQVGIVEELLK